MKQTRNEVTNEKLFEEFNTVIAEAERLLKSVASAGPQGAGSLRDGVEQSFASASERVAKIHENTVGQIKAAARATDEYVQGNPWRAVGIGVAAGVVGGLVTGLLITRR